jgi:hypothetical protein
VYTDWVFFVHWSFGADGRLEVWKNGASLVRKEGPNTYNDRVGPILKLGIYKAPWNDPSTPSAVSRRLLYLDEVRVAEARAGRAAVAPPGGP